MSDENRFVKIEERLDKIEQMLFNQQDTKSIPNLKNQIEQKIIPKIDKIIIPDLVILCLKLYPNITRSELKQTLENWGKIVGDWFTGGNLRNRLINTNIITISKKNDDGKEQFILTKKGEFVANQIIQEL